MGYSHSNEALDNPQKRFMNDMIVKLVENIPQSNLVIRESLKKKSSISFFQVASPSFGVFSASFTFSSIVGVAFKADRIYVYYDDVKAKVLSN